MEGLMISMGWKEKKMEGQAKNNFAACFVLRASCLVPGGVGVVGGNVTNAPTVQHCNQRPNEEDRKRQG
jgi:hypothetical protein